MKVNGYEIGKEPTSEEFATYRKVREFNNRTDVAAALKYIEENRAEWSMGDMRITQYEFDLLCFRIGKLDFFDVLLDAVSLEHSRIVNERS